MTRDEWIAGFTRRIGVEHPLAQEVRDLLQLAAVAPHACERTAAPLARCLASRSGRTASESMRAATSVAGAQPASAGKPAPWAASAGEPIQGATAA